MDEKGGSRDLVYSTIYVHTCKVKSHNPILISNEEYQTHVKVVENSNFFHVLQQAKQQVMEHDYTYEKKQYQEEFTLPLSHNVFGLFTIPVYINQRRCTFIIDTGAQISGLKAGKMKDLFIRKTKGSLSIGSIGGTNKKMQGLCANTFQIGAIEFFNLAMIALDGEDFSLRLGKFDLFGFDGILGWDILSQFDFEIDDIKKEFRVLKNHLKITHPNMIVGGFPCFVMHMEGYDSALFGFDSGSKRSWIGEHAISTYCLEVGQEGTAMGFGVHGLEKMELKIVKEVVCYLDKAKITLKNTMTGRTNLFDTFSFQGVLGNEIFTGRRIRFINSANMVLIA